MLRIITCVPSAFVAVAIWLWSSAEKVQNFRFLFVHDRNRFVGQTKGIRKIEDNIFEMIFEKINPDIEQEFWP